MVKVFARPGRSFEKNVTVAKESHEETLEEYFLSHDDLGGLGEQRLDVLTLGTDLVREGLQIGCRHIERLSSFPKIPSMRKLPSRRD